MEPENILTKSLASTGPCLPPVHILPAPCSRQSVLRSLSTHLTSSPCLVPPIPPESVLREEESLLPICSAVRAICSCALATGSWVSWIWGTAGAEGHLCGAGVGLGSPSDRIEKLFLGFSKTAETFSWRPQRLSVASLSNPVSVTAGGNAGHLHAVLWVGYTHLILQTRELATRGKQQNSDLNQKV